MEAGVDEHQRALIEDECRRLVLRYAHMIDFGDAAQVGTLFARDAVWESEYARKSGLEDIQASFSSRQEKTHRKARHVCTNILIDVESDTEASGTTYVLLYRFDENGRAKDVIRGPRMIGEYQDRFVRTADGWRFANRKFDRFVYVDPAGRRALSDKSSMELAFRIDNAGYRAVMSGARAAEIAPFDETLERLLHPNERAYVRVLRNDTRRDSYVLGRVAAKRAVCVLSHIDAPASVEIRAGAFGQPVVRAPAGYAEVTISHCDDTALVVAFEPEHPIGVDLERAAEPSARTVREHLGAAELSMLAELGWSDELAATMLWSAKEALAKVLRSGLTVPLNVLSISTAEPADVGSVSLFFENFALYRCHVVVLGERIVALAVPARSAFTLDTERLRAILDPEP
jgi:phosphopantetheinyl transferase